MGFVTSTLIGITDRGRVRENNEDNFVLGYPKTGQRLAERCRVTLPVENNNLLCIVSDGMGGARAGEIASRLTVEILMQEIPRLPAILAPQSRLEAAIEAANFAIWCEQRKDPKLVGMGATVTALFIDRGRAYIGEIGDSRAYLIRNNTIKQLTIDQTMLQAMLDAGMMNAQSAEKSLHRNVLLQAMGQEEHLQVACSSLRVQTGDIFLLCSDGLTGKVKEQEMYETVVNARSLDDAARQLINLANERGGDDNITVVMVKLEGEGLAQAPLEEDLHIYTRFDPEQELVVKPQRKIRPATYEDLLKTDVIEYFALTEAQQQTLMRLGRYGEYFRFRKGDELIFSNERSGEGSYHYWLISGRYRLTWENDQGEQETLALIVPPTDGRSDLELLADLDSGIPIQRQFLTPLGADREHTILWCEDETNIAIRLPLNIHQSVADIFGNRLC